MNVREIDMENVDNNKVKQEENTHNDNQYISMPSMCIEEVIEKGYYREENV